ncbi:WD repeat-containing protein 1 [Seminavis robusta]|uniref:WD repeat-containing protein 1 n=1 Tax=Seminavis robusta TaxID=568900 RepID=A0A9N8DYE6_9STRA|nr:WD repeat-containing protein 1 [Seminavis robusta]|eukprot:Sro341_g121540.1 WD repeat-containing protein 1 (677) ;mRNA; f:52861-54891
MPDASNVALPANYPVIASTPPVPTTERAQRCGLAGRSGRGQSGKPVLTYTSGKLVVVRNLKVDEPLLPSTESKLPVLTYRGHNTVTATAAQISPSGSYLASGDERGKLRVWALDHEEHLCKFDGPALSGPILDISWDGESKRLAVAGERSDAQSDAARVIQWDTGVSVGQLGQHVKGRVSGISFKPQRPMRIVTSGKEDYKVSFNAGPPFQKVTVANGVPSETAHAQKGSVNTVRYNHAGTLVASTGGDKMVAVYDGKTLELKGKLESVHNLTIFALEWSADDKSIVTCSSDGKVKLLSVSDDGSKLAITKTWDPPLAQRGGKAYDKLPVGGQQLGCAFVNGNVPVSVSFNGQLSVMDGDKITIWTGHSASINDMAVDFKNGVFYTGDSDGLLCQWDWNTAQPKKRLEPSANANADLLYVIHGGAISGVATMADGSLLSVGWDDKMFVTDKAGKVGASPCQLKAQPTCIGGGAKIAVIVTVKGLQLVKAGAGAVAGDLLATSYEGQSVCVSKDDKTVYVGGNDNKIYVYTCDGNALKEKQVIADGHRQPVHALALSNDGSKLAASDTKDVCVYDVKDGYKPIIAKGRWCFHMQRITTLCWSPDDKILASGGADDSIYLWSLDKKMKRKHYPYAHRGGLTALTFTEKKGEYKFVSVGMDAVVNQWDVSTDVKDTFGL